MKAFGDGGRGEHRAGDALGHAEQEPGPVLLALGELLELGREILLWCGCRRRGSRGSLLVGLLGAFGVPGLGLKRGLA